MRLNATGKSAWLKDEKYRDSIINVIGKAIGDCMALENEFRGKFWDRKTAGDEVILFEDEDKYEDSCDYTIANWNAVYLYNAVNLAINNEEHWKIVELNTKELLEECHRRIKKHYEQFYWIHTEGDKKRQRRNVSELDDQKNLIKTFLNQMYNEVIAPESLGFFQKDIDNIKKLQEAINKLDKNKGDIENFVKDAIDKLDAAKTVLLRRVSFKEGYLPREGKTVNQMDYYNWIKDYVLNRKDCTIASLELHKNLEQAKSDILKYFQALNLDEILRDVYRDCARKKLGSPATDIKPIQKNDGEKYDAFQYDSILMDSEVKDTKDTGEKQGNSHVIQEIGYRPHFLIKNGYEWQGSEFYHGQVREPINTIYIYDVFKFKLTRSENSGFDKSESKLLEEYTWKNKDKYKNLLELLRGLVVPFDPFSKKHLLK